MSDIEELQRRITAALDRVGTAMERIASAEPLVGPDLSGQLEAERSANAELEERVRFIQTRQETVVADLEDEVARLKDAVAAREAEVARLRAANGTLRENNDALREAAGKGVTDPETINAAMKQEIESLRADRAAERAEIDDILSALAPVLDHKETSHA